ncbi:DinB family protein [Kineococcus sp. SYSU DK004]|uniref:DinB family protein n=1 Tax=Kineococcus sp. SYSU DK004 TaxID=3383125 RepID=UPI003D7CD862
MPATPPAPATPATSSRVPLTAGEKKTLTASLDRHRDALLWKLEDLDDEQVRRPVLPSGLSLLSLVKHLASVEYRWCCAAFGRPSRDVPTPPEDPHADWRVHPWETREGVLAYYADARRDADAVLAELKVTDRGTTPDGEPVTLRRVLVQVVEEAARHAGRADVVRELIDGRTGEHRD